MSLPPLPKPEPNTEKQYDTDEVREYGELCRKLALEEAVKVCEAVEQEHLDTYKRKPGPNAYAPHFQGLSMGAGECAEKIGELLTLP